jgi:hypothetical protein
VQGGVRDRERKALRYEQKSSRKSILLSHFQVSSRSERSAGEIFRDRLLLNHRALWCGARAPITRAITSLKFYHHHLLFLIHLSILPQSGSFYIYRPNNCSIFTLSTSFACPCSCRACLLLVLALDGVCCVLISQSSYYQSWIFTRYPNAIYSKSDFTSETPTTAIPISDLSTLIPFI